MRQAERLGRLKHKAVMLVGHLYFAEKSCPTVETKLAAEISDQLMGLPNILMNVFDGEDEDEMSDKEVGETVF